MITDTSRIVLDPKDPYTRTAQIFPTLTDEQIERIHPFGREESLLKGTILFERGERSVDFWVVLEGNIEIYEYTPHRPTLSSTRT